MAKGEQDLGKRRNPRFDVANLDGRLAFNMGAEVVNISPAGMCVQTTSPLVIHRKYQISLGPEDHSISLEGTVRWCTLRSTRRNQADEIEPLYEAGVAFDGLLTDVAMPFLDFLRENVIVNLSGEPEQASDGRLFGRFGLQDSSVLLGGSDTFEVRRISLSGMLARGSAMIARETHCDVSIDLDGSAFRSRVRIVHGSQVEPLAGEVTDDDVPIYEMGVEFLNIPTSSKRVLERFIESHLANSEGTSATGT